MNGFTRSPAVFEGARGISGTVSTALVASLEKAAENATTSVGRWQSARLRPHGEAIQPSKES